MYIIVISYHSYVKKMIYHLFYRLTKSITFEGLNIKLQVQGIISMQFTMLKLASTGLKFIAQDAVTETSTTIIMELLLPVYMNIGNAPTSIYYMVACFPSPLVTSFYKFNTPHNLPVL